MRIHTTLCLAFLAIAGLTACATQGVDVSVDSIRGDGDVPGKHYLWRSGLPGVGEDDLYFREFSRYFKTVLAQRGYRETTPDQADLVILFRYGISPGRLVEYTTTRPLYDWVGGETIVITETQKNAQGKVTGETTRTLVTPTRMRLLGITEDTTRYTVFTSHVTLVARRWIAGRKVKEMPILWQTRISATSPNSDLRQLMPLLAAAAAPYIGGNTGAAKTVRISPDDPRVIALRRQVSPPSATTPPSP